MRVVVAPITHSDPQREPALRLPDAVARNLGLDSDPHWVVLSQLNRFAWPGYDLAEIPGRGGEVAYGMLSAGFYEQIRREILHLNAERKIRQIPR
ncbi:hypothetical protein SAMN06265365_12047 [Tistlia consotensis]|uniref:Uncharacterized protein n=1 Tax=Tistlia consotensis USBA 355 TaxID=560819 RepID=A0A1Y6BUU4_9PROT|nr:hypothetical protein [Tistlia consotensis]SMF29849.1 hypothetical protein SAMN05428998_11070 [Tistlia consotensis USBA 355]SNR90763.1 hypothetical protein SAMN06265365_12047 [Tistlia consotensis]